MMMDPIQDEAIHSERHVRIACIGAGPSGLLLAYKLQRSFRNFSLTVFEKNNDIGGTWHENTYPGCSSDIPAHNYCYSFEPKVDWSTVYASSQEVKSYFTSFTAKHHLDHYVKLNQQVVGAKWIEGTGMWDVKVKDKETMSINRHSFHIVVKATGYLNSWKFPDVPGTEQYQGAMFHSANWPKSIDVTGKDVILIGNGASAIQILPQIQPLAKTVTTIFRSPVWIAPMTGSEGQRKYTDEEINTFTDCPKVLTGMRKRNEAASNNNFALFRTDSILQAETKYLLTGFMQQAIANKALETSLIPAFSVGCHRIQQGLPYLRAIASNNVTPVQAGVESFHERGCRTTKGSEHTADIIICATGFDMTFKPPFPVIGEEDRSLQIQWASAPSSYMGVATSGFPNYFMMLGPYSPLASGSLIPTIETQVDYILGWVDRFQTENIRKFSPKLLAERDFVAHVAQWMDGAVYSDRCSNGHKNHAKDGRVPTTWPGSTLHYMEALREPRAEDWDVEYNGNRFAWLGNGFSQQEFDPTCDLAWYVCSEDASPYRSRRKRRELLTRTGTQPPRPLHRRYRAPIYHV